MNTDLWRIRPAGSSSEGRAVPYARLALGIESEEAGEMDEVRAPGEAGWVMIGEHPATSDLVPSRRMPAYRDTEEAESDMTPMIDVTFQLVIFFMIAATYTVQKTLDLPASQPDPEAAAAVTMEELEEENIIVKVAADGTVMVQDQVTPVAELANKFGEAIRDKQSAELVLDIDDEALHEIVVQVLDAAGAAGVQKVLFVSRVPGGGPRAP